MSTTARLTRMVRRAAHRELARTHRTLDDMVGLCRIMEALDFTDECNRLCPPTPIIDWHGVSVAA